MKSPDKKQCALLLVDQKHNCVLDQMLFPIQMFNKDKQRCLNVYNTALKVDWVV